MNAARVGDALVTRGALERAEAERIAISAMQERARFLSYAVKTKRVREDHALAVLANSKGYPAISLKHVSVTPQLAGVIPEDIAKAEQILAIEQVGNQLLVATPDPELDTVLQQVAFRCGAQLVPHAALQGPLKEALELAYSPAGYHGEESHKGKVAPVMPEHMKAPQLTFDPEEIEITLEADDVSEIRHVDAEDVLPLDAVEVVPAGSTPKILIVDDEEDVRDLVQRTLEPGGYEMETASRGGEALNKVKSFQPDLMVLDAMLPEVHGFEICQKVKQSKRFGQTRILMLSAIYRGWRMAEDVKTIYGADDFMEKPFRVSELRQRVENLLSAAPEQEPEADGASADEAFKQGAEAARNGDYPTATKFLTEAVEADPFSPRIHILLARVLQASGQTFQAIFHYERAVELDKNSFAAARNLAKLYQDKGFRNKALEMWERALWAAPDEKTREEIKKYIVSFL